MSDLIGKAKDIETIIDYQKGSVVSKTIIDKKQGTVTLFAFDKEQGLSEHTAPFDATAYIIDGIAEISIDGNLSLVNRGELIIMPAHKPHSLKAKERFKMLLIMIKPQ